MLFGKVHNRITNCKGLTLLETIVGLSLFLAVVIPLMDKMTSAAKMNKGKQKMVAACIIEQEAAILYTYPDEWFATKKRNINGIDWTVKASIQGDKLRKCHIQVFRRGKKIDKAIFYIHKSNE